MDEDRPNKYLRLKNLLIPYSIEANLVGRQEKLSKKKYGSGDGGYVLSPELTDLCSDCLSYGIGNELSFDIAIANLGTRVFMFDGSVDLEPTPKGTYFYKKNLNERNFANHVRHLRISHPLSNILKLDIEGCEYNWFSERNAKIAADNFGQIAIEVHGLIKEVPQGWVIEDAIMEAKQSMEKKCSFFERLNKYFVLFHIHGNNHSPRNFDLPDSLELTYVNRKIVEKTFLEKDIYPIKGLDEPNFKGRPDYILDWWV